MKDQLRKRAVWYLAVQELTFSMILGRTSCIKSDTIDLGESDTLTYTHVLLESINTRRRIGMMDAMG
jgi:hypothetical protein